MSDVSAAETPAQPLNEARARSILRSSMSFGYLADRLDHRCSCNACVVCAATFLVRLQDRLTGPVILITGWRIGMNKNGIGKLLHESGIPIGDAFRTVNQILENFRSGENSVFNVGPAMSVQVAEGIDRNSLVTKLRSLGLETEVFIPR